MIGNVYAITVTCCIYFFVSQMALGSRQGYGGEYHI